MGVISRVVNALGKVGDKVPMSGRVVSKVPSSVGGAAVGSAVLGLAVIWLLWTRVVPMVM